MQTKHRTAEVCIADLHSSLGLDKSVFQYVPMNLFGVGFEQHLPEKNVWSMLEFLAGSCKQGFLWGRWANLTWKWKNDFMITLR